MAWSIPDNARKRESELYSVVFKANSKKCLQTDNPELLQTLVYRELVKFWSTENWMRQKTLVHCNYWSKRKTQENMGGEVLKKLTIAIRRLSIFSNLFEDIRTRKIGTNWVIATYAHRVPNHFLINFLHSARKSLDTDCNCPLPATTAAPRTFAADSRGE